MGFQPGNEKGWGDPLPFLYLLLLLIALGSLVDSLGEDVSYRQGCDRLRGTVQTP
jgi:hypothetical protein